MIDRARRKLEEDMTSDRLTQFYADSGLEPAQMIGYLEQIKIFDKETDFSYLLEANRKLLRSHFLFYNAAFDSLWKYKYSILVLRCLFLAGSGLSLSKG